MEGTGGVRKLRWGRGSKGKSGGVRVIYYHHDERIPLYLLTIFAKSEKTNLTQARKPHGPALALLHVVAKEPLAVLRALA